MGTTRVGLSQTDEAAWGCRGGENPEWPEPKPTEAIKDGTPHNASSPSSISPYPAWRIDYAAVPPPGADEPPEPARRSVHPGPVTINRFHYHALAIARMGAGKARFSLIPFKRTPEEVEYTLNGPKMKEWASI